MDNSLISLMSSVCYGISFGLLAFFVMSAAMQLDSSDKVGDEAKKLLPPLIRIFAILAPLTAPLARSPLCQSMRESVEPRLRMAGYGDSVSAEEFVKIKLLFYLLAVLAAVLGIFTNNAMAGIIMAVMLAVYPAAWLAGTIKRRHLSILKALPNVLDLLTLSVEAGKDFLTSLRDILQRRKTDALGEELIRTFQEIQLGKKRAKALADMSRRVRQPDLTSVLNAIIQAEELGVSIGQLLRIQGDVLRSKRFSLAEKLANEAPVKIIPAIILFIFPAVLIILIVPIGMKIAEVML